VQLAGPQMSAAAGSQHKIGAADVHHALTLQYQHHLVVGVAVSRRPAGRYLAHELRCDRAATSGAEQDTEPPVSGRLDLAVTQIAGHRRAGTRCCAARESHRVQTQIGRSGGAQLVPVAWRDPQPVIMTERQARMAVHVQQAVSFDHEPQLAGGSRSPIEPRSRRDVDQPADEARARSRATRNCRSIEQEPHAGAGGCPVGADVGCPDNGG
jgi:hypothetical protein